MIKKLAIIKIKNFKLITKKTCFKKKTTVSKNSEL